MATPMFTYAAIREGNSVRIISIKKLHARIKNLHCVFSNSTSGDSRNYSVKASVVNIPEHHGSKYTAAFISCQMDKRQANTAFVGLVPDRNLAQRPSHMIPIQGGGDAQKVIHPNRALTSCSGRKILQALHVCYNRVVNLRFTILHPVMEQSPNSYSTLAVFPTTVESTQSQHL
ncbi:hypothetical protein ElyMa_001961000 [Elysia marginata]|uniref:Uncharacterized protein n=1 Tax=Elysia marginata TaxID=1093978 RepID=A0AAV4EY51_9GAST|nr:hypothetical protein ElyMa_001961000 [Elysia marginata]